KTPDFRDETELHGTGQDGLQRFRKPLLCLKRREPNLKRRDRRCVFRITQYMPFADGMAERGEVDGWIARDLARAPRVAKKLKLQERRTVIPSRRSLAACRPLHFFEAINGALCGSADKWGETHGVGTYPGLHYGNGGPGAAAAERGSGC